jgi:hypothetical protein
MTRNGLLKIKKKKKKKEGSPNSFWILTKTKNKFLYIYHLFRKKILKPTTHHSGTTKPLTNQNTSL